MMNRRECLSLVGLGTLGMALGRPAAAEASVRAAAYHFGGRTIRVLIPSGPGSGTDRSIRHFLSVLQDLIPDTRLRIENNERGGGRIMALDLWRAPGDGLTLGFPRGNLFYNSILGEDGANGFSYPDYSFIGSLSFSHRVCVLGQNSSIAGLDEMMAGERIVLKSASSVVSTHFIEALMLNALTGSRIRPIPGYEGGSRNMAVITGEVDCQIGTLEAVDPILGADAGRIVLRLSSRPLPAGYPQVPALREVLRDPAQAWVVDLIDALSSFGRPLAGPPDMDPAAAAHLRALFTAVVDDPAYRAEALAREGIDIQPSSGDEIEQLLASAITRGVRLRDDLEALLACGRTMAENTGTTCF